MRKFFVHIVVLSLLAFPVKAQAAVCCAACCACTAAIALAYGKTRSDVGSEFSKHKGLIISVLFEQHIAPAMAQMTEQLTVVAVQQAQMIGSFLDAKHQLETQRLFQQLQAQAHKDYHPSEGLCEIGTNVRSLAASERAAGFNANVLSTRYLDRQLLAGNTIAAGGDSTDKKARLGQFRTTYCDPADNANGLGPLCQSDNTPKSRRNKDIDFTRTLAMPATLDLDFADGGKKASPAEQDIFALAANLYGHDLPPVSKGLTYENGSVNGDAALKYMDLRALAAKRSVAQNSFAAITAMKGKGAPGSAQYMRALLADLGLPAGEIDRMLSDRPSYFAQMEVLTKKLYQNPNFYTNLYDKPANVARKRVALQAIELMQKRDMFRSLLRSESILSVMLESEVMKEQDRIINVDN